MEQVIGDSDGNGEANFVSEEISTQLQGDSSLPSSSRNRKSIGMSPSKQQKYYDEEVASDVNSPWIEESELDNIPQVHLQSPSGGNVQFSRQLSSPAKFKLRSLNMAGLINDDGDGPSPARIFSNSWSFGSPEKQARDGVVESDEEKEVQQIEATHHLPAVKSMEFNLDMIELAPSHDEYGDDKHDVKKVESNTSLEQLTDLQTDSEESEYNILKHTEDTQRTSSDIEGSALFLDIPETTYEADHYVFESKRPIHFIGWIVVCVLVIMVVPMVVDSVWNSEEEAMAPTFSPQVLNSTEDIILATSSPSDLQHSLSSLSTPSPTQTRMPSQSSRPTLRPSISPSMNPSFAPSPFPTSRPTKSASPTILSCEIRYTDGCDDYYHPSGWIQALHCTVSNSFLTCSIRSCFDSGDWPSWEFFFTNSDKSYFRIQPKDDGHAVILQQQQQQQDLNNKSSWTTLSSYPAKPSASEIVFGVPIGTIPDVERLRTWLVSKNEYGMDIDRIPKVGSLVFTGAADFCS